MYYEECTQHSKREYFQFFIPHPSDFILPSSLPHPAAIYDGRVAGGSQTRQERCTLATSGARTGAILLHVTKSLPCPAAQ